MPETTCYLLSAFRSIDLVLTIMAKRKKDQKRPKRIRRINYGWKKVKGGFTYTFKPKLPKSYKIKQITFVGFKETPTGLNLVKSGGGFNLWQTNKVGGNHLLSFLESK